MAALNLSFWTTLLGLPDYEVGYCHKEADLERYRLTVVPKHPLGVCPHCDTLSNTIHQTRTRERIKDLPLSNYAVELCVRVPQFQCCQCGHCFTPAIPFLAEGSHATERFLERAAQLIRTSDVTNAAAFLGVPERTLGDWYAAYLQRRPHASTPKLKPVRRIGIDELQLKKKGSSTSP
jgi:transposase